MLDTLEFCLCLVLLNDLPLTGCENALFTFASADNASISKSVKLFFVCLVSLLPILALPNLMLLLALCEELEELVLVDVLDLILVPTTLSLSPGGNPGIDNALLETISADDEAVVADIGGGGVKFSDICGTLWSLASSALDNLVTFFKTFLLLVFVFPLVVVVEVIFEFTEFWSVTFVSALELLTILRLEVTLLRDPWFEDAGVVGNLSVTIAIFGWTFRNWLFPLDFDCNVDSDCWFLWLEDPWLNDELSDFKLPKVFWLENDDSDEVSLPYVFWLNEDDVLSDPYVWVPKEEDEVNEACWLCLDESAEVSDP